MASIADRLERIHFARFHRRLMLLGGLGYSFDALDAAIVAFVLPALIAQWSLSGVQAGSWQALLMPDISLVHSSPGPRAISSADAAS